MPRMLAAFLGLLVVAQVAFAQAPPAEAPRRAQMPWWQRAGEGQAGHYWIKTDLPEDEVRALARHLNLMYEEYSRRLASLPPRAPTPMNVLIFAREFDYLDTMEYRFGIDATGTGGMFFVNRSGAALAFFTEGLPRRRIEHVVQHEGFHQFAWSRFGADLPVWVNEGLAEFFGESIIAGDEVIIGQSTARVVDAVKAMIEEGSTVPFDKLLSMSDDAWSARVRAGHAANLYQQAWSMVHFLVYGDDGRYVGRFEAYLRLLNAGYQSDRAFVMAFETDDVSAFEKRWTAYASAMEPGSFGTALERIEFLAAGAQELSRRGIVPETLADLAAQLQRIGFVQTLAGHGMEVRMATATAMIQIPWRGPELAQPPVFELTRPRVPASIRERHLEQAVPTPPGLETRFLAPHDLAIRWIRDREVNAFRYEIEIR